MRHRRRAKYFGVKTAHRKAMFRNMVTALFQHGRITTTVTRAKELRRVADKLISLGKQNTLHARRQALSVIMDKGVVAKLFDEWAPLMADRRGGYTRIVRIGPRRGDAAMTCIIELVTDSVETTPKAKMSKPARDEEVAPTVIPTAAPITESEDIHDSSDETAAKADITEEETVEFAESPSIEKSADEGSDQEAAEAEVGPEEKPESDIKAENEDADKRSEEGKEIDKAPEA